MPAPVTPDPAAPAGPPACLGCRHGRAFYTVITGCVRCLYPGEPDPRVARQMLIRMGAFVVPDDTARICPHYEGKTGATASRTIPAMENTNDQLGQLEIWRDKTCVDCGRKPAEARLNIEGVIHHSSPLRCVDRKSCERLRRRQSGTSDETP